MFDRTCRFTGYRGAGTEVLPRSPADFDITFRKAAAH